MLRKDVFSRRNPRRLIDGQWLQLLHAAVSVRRLVALIVGFFLATVVAAGTATYTYDALGRLTLATYDDGSSVQYKLDAAGNRISVATFPPLTAPTGLTVTVVSARSLSLSWSAGSGGSGGYTYKVYTSAGALVASPATTSYTNTGLIAHTSYSYFVTAIDSDGNESPHSAVASNTTYAVPTIGSFTGAPNSASSITLNWTAADANGPGLAPFSLTRSPGTLNASPAATATSYTDTGLTPGTSYTYTLVASDGHSDTATATATAATDPLPTISAFTAAVTSASKITLTWSATDKAQQGTLTYSVVRGATTLSCTTSPCVDSGLTPNNPYNYTLTATDALNEHSTASASRSTYPLPTASLSVQSVTSTSVTLAWTAADTGGPGLSGVIITRAGVQKFSGTGTSGTYTETGLTPNSPYTYTLTATDTASDVSAASTASATTAIGTFQFLGGSHSNQGQSGDSAVASIKNSGNATITGIVATTNNNSFLCNNITPTTLAPGATGTVSCSAFVATSNPASIKLTGTNVSNSGVSYSW